MLLLLAACTGSDPEKKPVGDDDDDTAVLDDTADTDTDSDPPAPTCASGITFDLVDLGFDGSAEPEPSDCALATDLDHDGDVDLAFLWNEAFHVLWGDGALGFTPQVLAVDTGIGGCLAADLDGDGLDEIVMGRGSPRIFIQQTAGSFAQMPGRFTLDDPVFDVGRAIAVGHFDGDGRLDLFFGGRGEPNPPFACTETGGDVQCTSDMDPSPGRILLQTTDNFFAETQTTTAAHTLGVSSYDHDGDGRFDLFEATDFGTNVALLSGDAYAPTELGIEVYDHAMHMLPVDLDADGHLDLVASDIGAVGVFRGKADGTFAYDDVLASLTADTYSWGVAAEDFDNDGDVDLFFGTTYTAKAGQLGAMLDGLPSEAPPQGSLDAAIRDHIAGFAGDQGDVLVENCGDGTYAGTTVPFPTTDRMLAYENAVAAADVDGDGRVDVLTVNPAAGPRLLRNTTEAGRWVDLDLPLGTHVFAPIRHVVHGGSAGGHSRRGLHLGAGNAATLDVRYVLPSGDVVEDTLGTAL